MIKRIALSLGVTVGLGFAFVPQGCGGVQPVADVPENVARPIRVCAFEHRRHIEGADHSVTFEVKLDHHGQIDSIATVDSDLGDEELEKCMVTAIRSLTQDDLLRLRPLRSENVDREPGQPESRNLLGNPAVPLAACLASPPCLLTLGLMMGATVITVQLMVHAATVKPTTTTTAPPIPISLPRKYPHQTCEEVDRIRLEAAKKAVCPQSPQTFPGDNCSQKTKKEQARAQVYPCSLILTRIAAVTACVAARQKVQDECFKGSPETGHPQQIDDLTKSITLCEALKLVNCAPGHPMSGL